MAKNLFKIIDTKKHPDPKVYLTLVPSFSGDRRLFVKWDKHYPLPPLLKFDYLNSFSSYSWNGLNKLSFMIYFCQCFNNFWNDVWGVWSLFDQFDSIVGRTMGQSVLSRGSQKQKLFYSDQNIFQPFLLFALQHGKGNFEQYN